MGKKIHVPKFNDLLLRMKLTLFELLNDDNDCSQTLDLIDSAYTDIKCKKINDILQRDTKNDVSGFIQN